MAERIGVCVKVKPPSEDNLSCLEVEGRSIGFSGEPHRYEFDAVFDVGSSNLNVYKGMIREIVHSAFRGYNGTCFAYGQTASGKTCTMRGSILDFGVIRLALEDIFNLVALHTTETPDMNFVVSASYFEIYQEDVCDLLGVENHKKLILQENFQGETQIQGLSKKFVSNTQEVLDYIETGEVRRHYGATEMNPRSSRPHTVLRLIISKQTKKTPVKVAWLSELNFVDLAGSERLDKTGATGVRKDEGNKINLSLSTLQRVIRELNIAGNISAHIPYLDSSLTRVLKSALGGNSKAAIICTVAADEVHKDETRGTLVFGTKAMNVNNIVRVNRGPTHSQLLQEKNEEINRLKRRLETVEEALSKKQKVLAMDKGKLAVDEALLEFEEGINSEEERIEQKTRISLLEKESENLDENLKFMTSERDGLQTEHGEMKQQALQMTFKIEEMEKERNTVVAKLEKQEGCIKEQEKKVSYLEELNANIQNQLQQITKERDEIKALYNDNERKMRQLEEHLKKSMEVDKANALKHFKAEVNKSVDEMMGSLKKYDLESLPTMKYQQLFSEL